VKKLIVVVLSVLMLASTVIYAADVAVLDSILANNFYVGLGWPYDEMMDGVIDTFKEAKIQFDVISDDDMANIKKLEQYKVLVLPDNRPMDTAAVEVVLKLVADGKLKVFGTYQSSFRDAANQRVGDGNFQLEEIYDMKYSSWAGAGNIFIGKPDDLKDHPIWKGLPPEIMLITADQMVCEWLGFGKPLGVWLDSSLNPMREEDFNVAVVETNGGIYCNGWFWHPNNTDDDDVRKFAVNIVNYLLGK
jgi:hypothetical protein